MKFLLTLLLSSQFVFAQKVIQPPVVTERRPVMTDGAQQNGDQQNGDQQNGNQLSPTTQAPASLYGCPYTTADQESQEILNSTQPVMTEALDSVRNRIQADETNCALPPREDMARIDSMMRLLAQDLTPRAAAFTTLTLKGQPLGCTATLDAFKEVIRSYQGFVLSNFQALPDNFSAFEPFMDLDGQGSNAIDGMFRDCHSRTKAASGNYNDFKICLQDQLTAQTNPSSGNSAIRNLWQGECGRDQAEYARNIQRLRELVTKTPQEAAADTRNVEQLISSVYSDIQKTVNTLTSLNPNCSAAGQVGMVAQTLANTGISLAQQMGGPVLNLALGLAIGPIQNLIRMITGRNDREKKREIERYLAAVAGTQDKREETLMCAMTSMQQSICRSHLSVNEAYCAPIGNQEGEIVSIRNTLRELGSFQPAPEDETPQPPLDYVRANISKINGLYESFFNKQDDLIEPGSDYAPSFAEHLFGSPEHQGALDRLDMSKLDRPTRLQLAPHRVAMVEMKAKVNSFKTAMEAIESGNYGEAEATTLKTAFQAVEQSLTSRNGAIRSIPPFLQAFYDQQISSESSDVQRFALRARNTIAGDLLQNSVSEAARPADTAERNSNANSLFELLSGNWSRQDFMAPMVERINIPARSVEPSRTQRAYDFDASIKNSIRECMYLYQPIVTSGHSGLNVNYRSKCSEFFRCQNDLGLNLPLTSAPNYNTHEGDNRRTIENFRPICDTVNNYAHIIAKARNNWVNNGTICNAN